MSRLDSGERGARYLAGRHLNRQIGEKSSTFLSSVVFVGDKSMLVLPKITLGHRGMARGVGTKYRAPSIGS